jgi:hypothetical protein
MAIATPVALAIMALPFLARGSGGGAGMKRAGGLPEMAFGLVIGLVNYHLHHDSLVAAAWAVFSWLAMERGHKNFYHDGTLATQFADTPGGLEKWSGLYWLLPRLGMPPRSTGYCRILMGLKWLLIGLPMFPFGLAMAILGPVAYWYAFRPLKIKYDSAPAEWLTGIFTMLVAAVALAV